MVGHVHAGAAAHGRDVDFSGMHFEAISKLARFCIPAAFE